MCSCKLKIFPTCAQLLLNVDTKYKIVKRQNFKAHIFHGTINQLHEPFVSNILSFWKNVGWVTPGKCQPSTAQHSGWFNLLVLTIYTQRFLNKMSTYILLLYWKIVFDKILFSSTYSVFGVSKLSSFWSLRHVLTNSALVTLPSLLTSMMRKMSAALGSGLAAVPAPAVSPTTLKMEATMSVISDRSTHPLPSTSYMLNISRHVSDVCLC